MASNVYSFLGWSLLPDFVTNNLHTFYYSLTIRAGERKPRPGSPTFIKHRRRIYTAVILAYLLYTLYEADWEIRRAQDYYQVLGVPHDVDEKTLQSRFRRLTLIHHPDKISTTDSAGQAAAESHYVHLKLARDTLLDPAKRFAYDRFGPDISQWRHCTTIRDYVLAGLQRLVGYYIGSAIFMLIFGVLGFFDWGKYWRYLIFVTLFVFEVSTLTRPTPPLINTRVLNPALQAISFGAHAPYLPFQTLQLARKATFTLFIAFSRLGPVLSQMAVSSNPATAVVDSSAAGQEAQLSRLEQCMALCLTEAQRLAALEIVPFQQGQPAGATGAGSGAGETEEVAAGPPPPPPLMGNVKARLRDWFVQNTIRNDKEVRAAVDTVLERRNMERNMGPNGAGRADSR